MALTLGSYYLVSEPDTGCVGVFKATGVVPTARVVLTHVEVSPSTQGDPFTSSQCVVIPFCLRPDAETTVDGVLVVPETPEQTDSDTWRDGRTRLDAITPGNYMLVYQGGKLLLLGEMGDMWPMGDTAPPEVLW